MRCQDCQYWERERPQYAQHVGTCDKLSSTFSYDTPYDGVGMYGDVDDMDSIQLLCGEDFGCIHFKRREL